jgi:histone-lysine N-methyltransferase SETMAR
MQRELGVSAEVLQKILHEELELRKICARWVPHRLTDDQKLARVSFCRETLRKFKNGTSYLWGKIVTGDEVWIYHYDPLMKRQSAQWVAKRGRNPTKVIRERSVGKVMYAIFFTRDKIISAIPLETQRTVTSRWYTEDCLPKFFDDLLGGKDRSELRRWQLHHDNAPAHTAKNTCHFLEASKIKLLPHPPYSPDLAPCDFYLFPKLKENLRGIRFETKEDLHNAVIAGLKSFTKADLHACWEKWISRMNKCIKFDGEYFEKQ